MRKAGSSAKDILQHLREATGNLMPWKSMDLLDVHNILTAQQRNRRRGRTDAEQTAESLREFCEGDGNSAAVSVDDSSGLVHAVCFQTAGEKRLFKAFPEVLCVDTTHGNNPNYYKLFSFQVNDVFGKDQYVQQSIIESERKENLTFCLEKVGSRCERKTEAKKEIVAALQLMMKVESSSAYSAYHRDMLCSLGNNKNDPFYAYFELNWE
ncbi:hypothetical protein PHMEG_0004296 [Phytophthora megakarya]|uniref:ZSWIM1/3 RNaseH-like domain-containing protein n=1 Tax=Phytophthora megakarya TaxID=4795 RepID=A0A225WVS9_9STRA|nr:hypothetical protein PHMEG_0004296 [Phytophthora megakarya]